MNLATAIRLAIATAVIALAAGLPVLGLAQTADGEPVTANGCTIKPASPVERADLIVARATVECPQALRGREVITELWQKDADGVWRRVRGSQSLMLARDILDFAAPANTPGASCAALEVDRTRRYRTLVKVSDGNGNFMEQFSLPADLNKDCLSDGDPTTVPAGDDEVVALGCAEGDVCAESHVKNTKYFYNCRATARNPLVYTSVNVGDGDYYCSDPYARRYMYAELCDRMNNVWDNCGYRISTYHPDGGVSNHWYPQCETGRRPGWVYEGVYTRVGADPAKLNGDDPGDKHVNSPYTATQKRCR